MIIKQQNETAKYEARLEKLNKTIKNKNELLQKNRIERILVWKLRAEID